MLCRQLVEWDRRGRAALRGKQTAADASGPRAATAGAIPTRGICVL